MARATFDGPILSGDNRFGPLRNVGYTDLVQATDIDFSVTTLATAGYSGGSSQFVWSNNIPNINGTVYTPSSTTFPSVANTPTADTSTNIYRGVVMYIPAGSQIVDVIVDYVTAMTITSSALTSTDVYVSNNFVTSSPTYASASIATTTVGSAGRKTVAYTGTQLNNMLATTTDILQPNGNPNLSQVVFTVAIVGTGLSALSAGKFNFVLRYVQPDNNIGTSTTYPYGNLD